MSCNTRNSSLALKWRLEVSVIVKRSSCNGQEVGLVSSSARTLAIVQNMRKLKGLEPGFQNHLYFPKEVKMVNAQFKRIRI